MNRPVMKSCVIALAVCSAFSVRGATMCSGESASVTLDLATGTRVISASETIRYSTAWVDGAATEATAVVEVNGETLKSATDGGYVDWMPPWNGTYTLTHKVMSGGEQIGETLTATFLVNGMRPNEPEFSPAGRTIFDSLLSVSISCPTEGTTIHYTTDGSEPTVESPVYRRFRITGKTTVKAIAEKDGMLSDVAVAEYAKGQCAEAVIDAVSTFTGSKSKVSLSCATEDAVIRYTLNGSDPNAQSTLYTGPFYITDSCTVKAYATTADYFDSAVATQSIEKVWVIGDTMGKPDHGFTTDGTGDAGWTRVTDATAPNGEAMKSGAITHSQSSVLSTKVMGPGTLSFSWRTSCEQDPDGAYEWDHAELTVDGVVKLRLDGDSGWAEASTEITGDGEHTVEWRYVKDDVESAGDDAAWVAGYSWASAWTATRTTEVPVPYAWLTAHDPDVVDEYEAYEASAKKTAANGRNKVWECYVVGLDPQDAEADFRITKFPMKADGTPDLANLEFAPAQSAGDVPGARPVIKGAAALGGEWKAVEGATAVEKAAMRFFKVVVELP